VHNQQALNRSAGASTVSVHPLRSLQSISPSIAQSALNMIPGIDHNGQATVTIMISLPTTALSEAIAAASRLAAEAAEAAATGA